MDKSATECDSKEFKSFYVEYRRQQDALQLIQQLNQMVRTVQRHRGMSTALLAGSDLFRVEFAGLQKQVERRLSSLEVFAEEMGGVLDTRDQECLHRAWHTIRVDWQDDDVIDNFELHSHFVEQLQGMVTRLSKTLEYATSVVCGDHADDEALNVCCRVELLSFTATQLPLMIEQIAKIRGLSAYAASCEECDDHHERKLRYEMNCAKSLSQKVALQAGRLAVCLGDDLESLGVFKTFDMKLTFLLNAVEEDIFSGAKVAANSHRLFTLATEIIDASSSVQAEAIRLVGRWHEDDLEAWLNLS